MKVFKYIVVNKAGKPEEIWACSACKKSHGEEILLGKWKLIDMRDSADIPCGLCQKGLQEAVNE